MLLPGFTEIEPGAVKKIWKIVSLGAGLGLLGWYLANVELKEVARVMTQLGWWAPLALLPYSAVYIVDCIGWRFCFPPALRVNFGALFRIRWAGEAINNSVPSGSVGGEAVKVFLLKRLGIDTPIGASSVVVGRSAQTAAQLLFIMAAAVAFLQIAGNEPGLRASMASVIVGGITVLAGLFLVQRRGLFRSALDVARLLRVSGQTVKQHTGKLLEIDGTIRGFYQHHRGRFYASAGCYLGGWLLDTVEIWLVAHLLGMPISWFQALAVEAFVGVIKIMGLWVPGSIGVQESGILVLGRMAGLPDTLSASYALLRRVREIIFALAGWCLLYSFQASPRMIQEEMSSSGRVTTSRQNQITN